MSCDELDQIIVTKSDLFGKELVTIVEQTKGKKPFIQLKANDGCAQALIVHVAPNRIDWAQVSVRFGTAKLGHNYCNKLTCCVP